ncbi:MAG: DUF4954 family protein [Porphyromonadaceae bacterium]|jgi:hypothetical protein|nr:DUF4954 family protein [Porphyromonadaceae bacterium]
MKRSHRPLTEQEIATMTVYGCTAEDWGKVEVKDGFDPKYVSNVHFSGNIKLGVFEKIYEMGGGFRKHSGLYNTAIHNCVIGDNVFIDKIHNYIANYEICDEVYIENTNIVYVEGKTSFGNGVRVPVMNETGGREIPIFNELSAPLAYILTFYRHRPEMISNIQRMIDEYSESVSSTMGRIGKKVQIINCGRIKNVWIDDYASIKGVSSMKNGTISSTRNAPVKIGSGVKCKNFIVCSGVQIADSTLISSCFVGQGSIMEKHYSALDSVFFSNCQGMHGEATAIFAGPYTVSHHKSSLLIAGMYSFLNAGSGSNQSNHMYKLGPIHQGVVERGSKTTSDSYILWPAKIGAFTLVMGRHTSHPDTTDLPFSYLIENATESILVPGVNLRSVGTVRDAQKWPKRDNRTDKVRIDPINFNLLSPYTIHKMYKGIETLENIKKVSGETSEIYSYHNCKIKNSSLIKGIELYKIGIYKFLGNSLISKIEKEKPESFAELQQKLVSDTKKGLGDWIDLAGLIAPKAEVYAMLDEIEDNKMTLKQILDKCWEFHNEYYNYEWTWAQEKLERYWKKPIQNVTKQEVIDFIEIWKNSVVNLDYMLYDDAKKEFDLTSMTGFGVDGDEEQRKKDFENVRGKFDQNPFVQEVLNHIERKTELGNRTGRLVSDLP